MKIKSEKGITGVDITLSVILITIFIGILTTISYNIQNDVKQVNRQAEVLEYAITSIEELKALDFNQLPTIGNNKITGFEDGYITDSQGKTTPYYKTITVQDYKEIDTTAEAEIVKKVTVEILYKFKNKNKSITLSAIKVKEQ